VRWIVRRAGIDDRLAVRHLPHVGVTSAILPNESSLLLRSEGDDWVSNQVFWRGWSGYEPEVTPIFWRLATEARVTLDVGAHVGFYSIIAAKANPAGQVHAFEPLLPVFARLQRNLRLNHLDNVVAVRKAAGAHDGTAEFFHVPGVVPCSSSLSQEYMSFHEDVASTNVAVVRLDSYAQREQLPCVDLIKVDTETTEPEVLAGMRRVLSEHRPDIFCEVLPSGDGTALTSVLSSLGYSFYLLTNDGPQRRERVVAHHRWFNYLFTARRHPDMASHLHHPQFAAYRV
jgi:FkbM family methyltransferase